VPPFPPLSLSSFFFFFLKKKYISSNIYINEEVRSSRVSSCHRFENTLCVFYDNTLVTNSVLYCSPFHLFTVKMQQVKTNIFHFWNLLQVFFFPLVLFHENSFMRVCSRAIFFMIFIVCPENLRYVD
jgi:hypothetical protein